MGSDLVGSVWPGEVHFPDFLHPNTDDYWCEMLEELYKLVPYDGIWLDMNEIANFISGEAGLFLNSFFLQCFIKNSKNSLILF